MKGRENNEAVDVRETRGKVKLGKGQKEEDETVSNEAN